MPGVILVGFGLHFHLAGKIAIWPDNIGVFVLIIAIGFLLRSQKTGDGTFYGLLFLVLSILLLFSDKAMEWFGLVENNVSSLINFWPAVLVVIGVYLLFAKRRGGNNPPVKAGHSNSPCARKKRPGDSHRQIPGTSATSPAE